MNVSEIMSTKVVTVGMDDRLSLVKEIFDGTKFHHLVVIEEGAVFGILSDRDLLKSISPNIGTNRYTPRDLETLDKCVHTVMTRKPICVHESASVADVITLLNKHTISCVPVVDEQNHIVGIITWRDILKNFSDIAIDFAAQLAANDAAGDADGAAAN